MKVLSRKVLVALSIEEFENNAVSTLFATVDGQFFIHENRAKLHNNSIKGGKVYEIDKTEADEALKAIDVETDASNKAKQSTKVKTEDTEETTALKAVLELSNKKVENAISTVDKVDFLEKLLTLEKANKNRSGSISAIEDRIAFLNANAESTN